MNFWILSDTHFGHERMHDFCGRPQGFEQLILDRLKKTVTEDDILIHLGDFCFGRDADWHERFIAACPARRWLVRGNHDKKSNHWYLSHGWDCVADRLDFKQYGERLTFSHKPLALGSFPGLNIHGHLHNTGHHPGGESPYHHNVYLEHEYRPIPLQSIVESIPRPEPARQV